MVTTFVNSSLKNTKKQKNKNKTKKTTNEKQKKTDYDVFRHSKRWFDFEKFTLVIQISLQYLLLILQVLWTESRPVKQHCLIFRQINYNLNKNQFSILWEVALTDLSERIVCLLPEGEVLQKMVSLHHLKFSYLLQILNLSKINQ